MAEKVVLMDLMTAKVEAASKSKEARKKIFITLDEKEGEFFLSDKRTATTMHVYLHGSEVPLEEMDATEPAGTQQTKASKKKETNGTAPVKEEAEQPEKKLTSKNKKSKNNKVMATVAKKSPAKKSAKAPVRSAESRIPRGNNMFLTAAEWKKVDALLAKEKISFSAWSRGLVLAKIK